MSRYAWHTVPQFAFVFPVTLQNCPPLPSIFLFSFLHPTLLPFIPREKLLLDDFSHMTLGRSFHLAIEVRVEHDTP